MELIPGPKLDETQIFIKYVLFLKQEHRALLLPILTFLKSLVVHFYTMIARSTFYIIFGNEKGRTISNSALKR